ncbi:MAG: hypothetical protein JRI68_11775 [Deltaproteobacteria bacterium]|nr:hypothetical protein [Deltaproteobacteria bacterium]
MRTYVSALSALCATLLAAASSAQPPPEPPPEPADPPTPPAQPEPPKPADGEVPPPPAPTPEGPPDAPPEDTAAGAAGGDEVLETVDKPMMPPLEPAPAPGPTTDLPPIPLPPPAIFPSQLEDEDRGPGLAGIHGGRVFLRDADDNFRFYPGLRLRTDFYSAPGAPDLPATEDGSALNPYLAVRRLRLEMSGEILKRLAFTGGFELGGGRIGDTTYAGLGTSRFAMASAHDGVLRPADVTVSYRLRKWLSFTVGQSNAPFSMSNRTREHATPFMERNVAIRGFVVPTEKELGLTVWGDVLDDRMLSYEVGIYSGDGPQHPAADDRPDLIGRIFARPLASLDDGTFTKLAQIGISARHGERDQAYVDYDYPGIATGHGFVLWQPGYIDSLDRVTHVIPSGAQNAIGGELRLPFRLPSDAVLELRGEAYYVENNTREAIEGFQQTNTERFGRVNGVGWYAMVSWWSCCLDQLVSGEPGITRPVTVDLDQAAPVKRGLEISAMAAGIAGNYSGATRLESTADANTPDKNIAIYQFGGAIQYWYSWNFRAAINYMVYLAPDSGDPSRNQAIVPDNMSVQDGAYGDGNLHHELGTRLAISF